MSKPDQDSKALDDTLADSLTAGSDSETSDDHSKLYGMRAEDFKTTDETCPTCENRIDELGWCGHGNMGGD